MYKGGPAEARSRLIVGAAAVVCRTYEMASCCVVIG
jgi:hypothetical protein